MLLWVDGIPKFRGRVSTSPLSLVLAQNTERLRKSTYCSYPIGFDNLAIVIPTAPSGAIVLEAVKVWPGKAGACRKVGTTANLDSSCARWRERSHGRDEETDFQIEQRN